MTEQRNNLAELNDQLEALKDQEASIKARLKGVVAMIDMETAEAVQAAVKASGKTHGVIYTEAMNGGFGTNRSFTGKIDIAKKVKWDSAKLLKVAMEMPWAQVQKLFKLEASVPERIYDGIEAIDPVLFKKIEEARTVELSPPKVTLVEED
jgi:hypothetical protein